MLNKQSISKFNYLFFLLIFATGIVYIAIGYYTQQSDFAQLSILYFFLFSSYVGILKYGTEFVELKHLLVLAVLFRLLLFGLEPNLSEDYFRFIWDGKLLAKGFSPYLYLPKNIITDGTIRQIPLMHNVYGGLSELSRNNYSAYPPLNQFIFAFSAFISPHSLKGQIIVLRIIILLAEAGTLYFGTKILKQLDLSVSNILIYAFNPLVIVELTGNLHFEAVMIFFVVLSLYFLWQSRLFSSAIALAAAASIKLVPLLLLPLLFRKLRFKEAVKYYLITGLLFLVLFLPFFSYDLISNFLASLSLYFQNFEFNASIYYLIREIGFFVEGYDILQLVGLVLAGATLLSIIFLAFRKENENREGLLISMLFALSIYYFLSTTVQPWHISIILLISCFTKYKFVILWTFLIILSYEIYRIPDNTETIWLIMAEYLLVYVFMFYELIRNNRESSVT